MVEPPLSAIVSQPEHHGSGRNKYTSYKVEAEYGNGQKSVVRRRYSDFYWLQQQLLEERTGIIVPVYKHKTVASPHLKFEDEFVAERLASLLRFLQRVVSNSELVSAKCLYQFLTLNPRDWEACKASGGVSGDKMKRSGSSSLDDDLNNAEDPSTIVIDATQPAQEKKKGWGQWMKEKRQNYKISRGTFIMEETPAESKKRTDLETYVEHLETCVRILGQDAKALVEAQAQQAEKMKTMGAAFTELWGEHTLQNTSSSNMYQHLGECWAELSSLGETQASKSAKDLDDPLDELLLEVLALKQATGKRKSTLVAYTKAVQNVQALQQQFDKMKKADLSGSRQDQYFQLEKDLNASDAEVAKFKNRMEVINSRLEYDVDRFRLEFHERMRAVMQKYHMTQFDLYGNQMALTWQSPLLHLKANQLESAPSQPQPKAVEVAPQINVSHSTLGATVSVVSGGSNGNANDTANLHAAAAPEPGHKSIFDITFDTTKAPPQSDFLPSSATPAPAPLPAAAVLGGIGGSDATPFEFNETFEAMAILGEAPSAPNDMTESQSTSTKEESDEVESNEKLSSPPTPTEEASSESLASGTEDTAPPPAAAPPPPPENPPPPPPSQDED